MVPCFGAGVFTMRNAMAIILGANLGTTLDSWVVATLGFNMDIEVVSYPAVCAGGLILILFGSRKTYRHSYFLFLIWFIVYRVVLYENSHGHR
jgi:phosphate:Na+ symporter